MVDIFESEDELNEVLVGEENLEAQDEFQNIVEGVDPQVPDVGGSIVAVGQLGPDVYDSEAAFQAEHGSDELMSPESLAPSGVDAGSLAQLVLGQTVPELEQPQLMDRRSIVESYGPENNTLAMNLPPGLEDINPADMELATKLLADNFLSMSETGILLDPQDRVVYATSVMENTSVRSDVRAQLVDQAMRDGKILPQALPKSWYEARGLILLPPDLNVEGLLEQ